MALELKQIQTHLSKLSAYEQRDQGI